MPSNKAIRRTRILVWLVLGLLSSVACATNATPKAKIKTPANAPAAAHDSLWAIDFIKTKDGEFENYLRFIDLNWTPARQLAVDKGYALSYRVYVLDQAAESPWDVLLVTEYRDRDVIERLEEIYAEEIFPERGPIIKVAGKGPREMADIVDHRIMTRHGR